MNASRTACSRCSHRIRVVAAQTLHQTAKFVSSTPRDSLTPSKPVTGPKTNLSRIAISKFSTAQGQTKPANDPALDLFNDVVSPESSNAQQSGRSADRAVLGELEIAGKLREVAGREDLSADRKFDIFRTEIWPHIKQIPTPIPKPVSDLAVDFLTQVQRDSMFRGHEIDGLELSRTLSLIGKWSLDIRADIVMNLCGTLVASLHGQDSRRVDRNALSIQLIDMWKHITQIKRIGQTDQELRFILPSEKEVLKDIATHAKSKYSNKAGVPLHPITKELASMLLQFNAPQWNVLAPALLATLAVLSDKKLVRPQVQQDSAPLLQLVAVVLNRHEVTPEYVHAAFGAKTKYPQRKKGYLVSYTKKQWPSVVAMLTRNDAPWRQSGAAVEGESEAKVDTSLITGIEKYHKQLRAAYRARNTGAVASVWDNLKTSLRDHPELAEQMRQSPQFLDFWIFVWCAVRRPQKLQETMEMMQQVGVQPTVKTYTAMMHGWKMCRDPAKIEALWHQLTMSGMKLDMPIWTERISSLIEVGKPQAGIQALSEMVSEWKQAVKEGRQSQAVEPGIEVVNAAFKGLVRVDPKAAHEVLAWAGREGFVPNIRTYNILLQESFRSGHAEDIQDLLRSMKTQGIEPDAATFTLILEEVIGGMGEAPAAEQVAAVKQVFVDIETAGLKPNMETYGKMLYAIASLANGSDEAIAAVEAHMASNGFRNTPHMVTILIERALGQQPPNIAAVRDLLTQHKLVSVEKGDQTLWERAMSAFAVAGERAEAMQIFDDLASAGRPVTSLPCLTDLLKLLLAEGDVDDAKRVVGVVLGHKMTSKEEFKERYWRHHFWFLAKENRLMTKDQAPHLFA